jgi:hypothetical protein
MYLSLYFNLILHILFSITGPYILRITFLWNPLSALYSTTLSVHVFAPYVAKDFINVLYTCILVAIILLLNVL